MKEREIAKLLAFKMIGTPYIWGGDDPMTGFDCSGFIVELLKSVGKLSRRGDWGANSLSKMWPETNEVKPGCLVFYDWNKDGRIDHVEFVFDVTSDNQILTIGASGGDSRTTNKDKAIRQDAYIKMRPARTVRASIVDPFK